MTSSLVKRVSIDQKVIVPTNRTATSFNQIMKEKTKQAPNTL